MRVYIITTGDQNSYSIRAVTDNEEMAKEYCEIFSDKNSHAVIETYETDNIGFDYTPGMLLYEVSLKEIDKLNCERVSVATINEGNFKINKVYKLYDNHHYDYKSGYYVYVEANSQEEALNEGSKLIYKYISAPHIEEKN